MQLGKFPPWGRWEAMEDGRVMLSFRCSCRPRETVNEYVRLNGGGQSVKLLCPLCGRTFVAVSARTVPAQKRKGS